VRSSSQSKLMPCDEDADISDTGICTSPKLIAPFQIDRAIDLPRMPLRIVSTFWKDPARGRKFLLFTAAALADPPDCRNHSAKCRPIFKALHTLVQQGNGLGRIHMGERVREPSRGAMQGVMLAVTDAATPEHELKVHTVLGTRIAEMLDCRFLGLAESPADTADPVYLIPDATLTGDQHHALGIKTEADFFGGSVPFAFVGSKAISHPLVSDVATAPRGWSAEMMQFARKAVLKGFTAFSTDDARQAGAELLVEGAVRLKPAAAKAGRGQLVVRTPHQLDTALDSLGSATISHAGLVLEQDVENALTFSVGQVRVAGITASYCGHQTQTRDNDGEWVYGGSELLVVRGDYGDLLAAPLSQQATLAVTQARLYEHAALQAYPQILASRRNYDVLQGTDVRGHLVSGVLEQSWRIGGASSAEIYALEQFARDDQMQRIRVASIERYGRSARLPPDSYLLFRGDDPNLGYLSKGVRILSDDNTY